MTGRLDVLYSSGLVFSESFRAEKWPKKTEISPFEACPGILSSREETLDFL